MGHVTPPRGGMNKGGWGGWTKGGEGISHEKNHPTDEMTNNCGGHMSTGGPDVCYSHASNSDININHG